MTRLDAFTHRSVRTAHGRIALFLAATVLAGAGFMATAEAASTMTGVGTIASAHGTNTTTLAVSPVNAGDVEVLGVRVFSSTIKVSSVSGGGAGPWTRLVQHSDATDSLEEELWMGPVTTAGPSTVTVAYSASVAQVSSELVVQEFSSGLGTSTTWSVGATGGQTNASSSTKIAFPSLTATGSGALYVGYAFAAQSGAAGTTAGTTYQIVPSSKDVFLYDTNVSGTLAPSAAQSPSGTSSSVGALLTATGSAPPPPPPPPTGATVTGVSPSSGPTGGGTVVKVTGTNLTGAIAVDFGTTAGTNLTGVSATSVTVSSPPGSTGPVDVTVVTPGGTSPTTAADQFTYTSSTPGPISAVGGFTSASGLGITTRAVSPQNVGDVLAVVAMRSTTGTLTSVSGGGVTTWTKGVQFAGSVGADQEIWFGKVTSTGSSTITFTWSGTASGFYEEYGVQEFTAGLGANTAWALDKSGSVNGASSTAVPFPSLTPSGSGELYFGYSVVGNVATGGSASGFTYDVTAEKNLVTFDTNVTGAVSPTGAQSPAATSQTIAVLLSATTGAPPPPPSGVTVTGVSPSSGPTAGGTVVNVTGTNFTGATAVDFGTTAGTNLTGVGATSLTVSSPPGSTGPVDITVVTPGGTSPTTAADQFTYTGAVTSASLIPLGVYPPAGGGNPASIASYAQATGTHPTLALDFLDKSDGWAAMDSASVLTPWIGTPYRLVIAVPIIPTNSSGTAQGTLAAGATGAYNQYFTTLGQNLVSMGLSNAILRLGWEFNGNWYAWSVASATDAAHYVSFFQQIVTTMRAVPGEQFKFFWNPNGPSPTSYTPAQAYPGNAYVDYVGTDVYDNSWVTPFTPAVGWSNQLTQQWGLNWLASFAAQNNKPIAIAEWSDEYRDDGHGFGDDPSFIDNMAAWFVANNVAFTDNFCYDSSSTYRNDLLDGTFPNALAEFEKDFG